MIPTLTELSFVLIIIITLTAWWFSYCVISITISNVLSCRIYFSVMRTA